MISTFARRARKQKILPWDQRDSTCPVLLAKIFRFRRRANHLYRFARLGPHEGRIAIVTDVGHEMRWTRQRRARNGIAGRVFIDL